METCPVCGVAFEAPADKGLLTRCPACKCDYLSSGAGAAPLRRPGSLSDRPGDRVTLPATFTERFRLGKLLGSGESSIVFLADDLSSDRRVAVKFLARASGPDQMARFLDERRRVGQVEHPNVAATIDVLELDGCPCLVTEYVEGGSLRQRLSVRKRLGAREAVRVATEVLAGLAACHAVGLVHGALRPENVLFVTHGTVKISDFGIAWNPDAANEESAGESTIGAAWPYVAPECYTEGEAAPGSDVYSAGVILCEMLTGSRPYDATTP
ncbi:MAG: serine/threonine protein kinase [Candidatus Riflebacteria bacterium]|nr:serine/threonine protein kinase [Candidatus Riflebacteria bacterium]